MSKDEALNWMIENHKLESLQQPTQEPVAWMSEEVLPLNHIIKAVVRREPDEQYTIPLYTHPKEWQGLSDDEIWNIANFLGKNKRDYPVMFAKTIEKALKEKNT